MPSIARAMRPPRRVAATRMARPSAVTMRARPSTAWMDTAAGPLEMAPPSPAPWSWRGRVTNRFTPMPRPYCTSSSTAMAKACRWMPGRDSARVRTGGAAPVSRVVIIIISSWQPGPAGPRSPVITGDPYGARPGQTPAGGAGLPGRDAGCLLFSRGGPRAVWCGTGSRAEGGTRPGTGAAAGQPAGAPAAGAPAGAPGWTGWAWRVSGPERSSAPQMTAPAAKMAAVHQNATV